MRGISGGIRKKTGDMHCRLRFLLYIWGCGRAAWAAGLTGVRAGSLGRRARNSFHKTIQT